MLEVAHPKLVHQVGTMEEGLHPENESLHSPLEQRDAAHNARVLVLLPLAGQDLEGPRRLLKLRDHASKRVALHLPPGFPERQPLRISEVEGLGGA